ncbi:hypothetical protein [Schumannella luteola]
MSYDIAIFFQEDPGDRLTGLIAAEADLTIAVEGGGITVTRGKGSYCCSIGEPVRVEEEDLPDEIVSRSVEFSFQVDVLVEGSNSASIDRTRKLVRHIVRSLDGVSWDPQTEAVDPSAARRAVTPTPAGLVNLVEIDWYAPRRDGVATAYIEATHRYLPEAAPRRFGTHEPLQYRLDRDGPGRFISEAEGGDMLFFHGTKPVLNGSISVDDRRGAKVSISILAASLHESAWRAAVQALFLDLAGQLGCFFASAQVIRNLTWSGRQIWYGPEAERKYSSYWREGWMGLPPHPVWWAYLGAQYTPLINLNGPGVSRRGEAAFVEHSRMPADRDALAATLPRRGLLRRPVPWIAPVLQMKAVNGNPGVRPPSAERAEIIPDGLGVNVAPAGYRM